MHDPERVDYQETRFEDERQEEQIPEFTRDEFQLFAGLCECCSGCMLWAVDEAKLYGKFGGDEFEVESSLHFGRCLCDCRGARRSGLGAIHFT